MNKIVLILFLLIGLSFAQYGGIHIEQGDCETPGGGVGVWADAGSPVTNDTSSTQKHGGTYSRQITADSQYDGTRNQLDDNPTGDYKVVFWIYGDGVNKCFIRVYNGVVQTYSTLSVSVAGYVFPNK